mgnify:CR=1 FL=1
MTEPDKINLRAAREEDVPAMAGLLSELFSLEKDFRPDLDRQMRGLRLLLKQPQLGRLFVASADDGIVGMVSLLFTVSTAEGGPAAILEDMIVASPYRGQGIGRRLVEHVMDRAAKSGRDHTNFTSATGAIWDAIREARRAVVPPTTSGLRQRRAPKSPPSLWVGDSMRVCGVAKLANGTTIRCAPRLASIACCRQRRREISVITP